MTVVCVGWWRLYGDDPSSIDNQRPGGDDGGDASNGHTDAANRAIDRHDAGG